MTGKKNVGMLSLNDDGTPDNCFGTNGLVEQAISTNGDDVIYKINVLPTSLGGGLLVAGESDEDLIIAKYKIALPTSIDNVYKNAILQLFPNPSRGILIINLKGLSVESVNAKIYNLSGNLIISQKIKTGEDTAIDVIELPTGQYLISLQDNEQRTIVAKNFSVY